MLFCSFSQDIIPLLNRYSAEYCSGLQEEQSKMADEHHCYMRDNVSYCHISIIGSFYILRDNLTFVLHNINYEWFMAN